MRINQAPVKKLPSFSQVNLSVFSDVASQASTSSSSSSSRSLSRKGYRKSGNTGNDSQFDLSQVLNDLMLGENDNGNEDTGPDEAASSGETVDNQPRDPPPQMQEIPLASTSGNSVQQLPRPKAYARKSTAKPPQTLLHKYRTKPTVPRRNAKCMPNYKSLLDVSIQKSRPQKKKRSLALKEIRHFQQTTHLLFQKLPFQRLIREIVQSFNPEMRMRKDAVEALQVSSEDFLTERFEDGNLMALQCNRVTLFPRDMQVVKRVKRQGM